MKRLQILLLTTCLFWCCSIKGQDNDRYEIKYITLDQAMVEDMENSVVKKKKSLSAPDGVNGYQIVRLDFFDKMTDKVIKSFDVYANSPFENLGYPVTGVNFEGGSIYRVENVQPKDSSLFFNQKLEMGDSLDFIPHVASSLAAVNENGKTHTVVVYGFVAHNANDTKYSSFTSIKILNSRGEVVHSLYGLDVGYNLPTITENGKYLAFNYGGCMDETENVQSPPGVKIFDATSGSLILDFIGEKNEKNCCSIEAIEGFIRLETKIGTNPNSQFVFRFFDLENSIIYSKSIPYQERNHLFLVTPISLIFKEREGKRFTGRNWTYTFNDDFQKIKIQKL